MSLPSDLLEGAWIHSHEEDKGDDLVFRPSSFAFPPSRGRNGFELQPGGAAQLTGPDSTDRPTGEPGTWQVDPADRLVLSGGNAKKVYEVKDVTAEKLVVKRVD